MLYVLLDRKIAAIEFLPIRDIKKSSGNVLFCGKLHRPPNVAISGEYFLRRGNTGYIYKEKRKLSKFDALKTSSQSSVDAIKNQYNWQMIVMLVL